MDLCAGDLDIQILQALVRECSTNPVFYGGFVGGEFLHFALQQVRLVEKVPKSHTIQLDGLGCADHRDLCFDNGTQLFR